MIVLIGNKYKSVKAILIVYIIFGCNRVYIFLFHTKIGAALQVGKLSARLLV